MPRAKLGQHFLIDDAIAHRIADAVDIRPGELIVEIGPGSGSLTRHLVPMAAGVGTKIVLVELDELWATESSIRYNNIDSVSVMQRDARDLDIAELLTDNECDRYKAVGNLPYYAGTPIVRRFLEAGKPPDSMVVMLQREVALEMVAQPGQMSLLSLAVQVYASGDLLFNVEPTAFRPRPKVRSSVVRLTPHAAPLVGKETLAAMFEVARACFRGKRKQLHNAMSNGLRLSVDESKELGRDAGIDTSRRPATLSVDEWVSLAQAWMKVSGSRDGK